MSVGRQQSVAVGGRQLREVAVSVVCSVTWRVLVGETPLPYGVQSVGRLIMTSRLMFCVVCEYTMQYSYNNKNVQISPVCSLQVGALESR